MKTSSAGVHLAQWICAILLNFFVLFLILRYSTKAMGRYKLLLVGYTIFNVIYVTTDMLVAPTAYIVGKSFLLVSLTSFLTDDFLIYSLLFMHCSSCSGLLIFLTFQFAYRCVVVCRAELLRRLTLCRTLLLGIGYYMINWGTWTVAAYFALNPEAEILEVVNVRYKNITGRDIIGTMSPTMAFADVSTPLIIRSYIGISILSTILAVNWALMSYCAWALNAALNFDQSLSPKTRTLQKELFRALVIQLIVPTLFVFGPLCFFFISAVVGFENWITDITSVLMMFDPILEPLVLLWFIKRYRTPVVRWLGCGWNSMVGSSNGAKTLTKGAKPPNTNLVALQPPGERIAEKPELADRIDDGSGNAHNIDMVEPAVR